mmetsp:Transcript_13851/g.35620  ORF Transcript_13851/g.35620 Transcript_13851/m.35620 type:complete len:387 (+) Transcript_13851:1-1161(+)
MPSSQIGGSLPPPGAPGQNGGWFGSKGDATWSQQGPGSLATPTLGKPTDPSAGWGMSTGLPGGASLPWADESNKATSLGWDDNTVRERWGLDGMVGTDEVGTSSSPWDVESLLETDASAPSIANQHTWAPSDRVRAAPSDGWSSAPSHPRGGADQPLRSARAPWLDPPGIHQAPPGLAVTPDAWSPTVPGHFSAPFGGGGGGSALTGSPAGGGGAKGRQGFAATPGQHGAVGLDGASRWAGGHHGTTVAPSWMPPAAPPPRGADGGLQPLVDPRRVLAVQGFAQMGDARKVKAFVEEKFAVCGYNEVPKIGCILFELSNAAEAAVVKDLLGQVRMGGRPLRVEFASADVVDSFKQLQQRSMDPARMSTPFVRAPPNREMYGGNHFM